MKRTNKCQINWCGTFHCILRSVSACFCFFLESFSANSYIVSTFAALFIACTCCYCCRAQTCFGELFLTWHFVAFYVRLPHRGVCVCHSRLHAWTVTAHMFYIWDNGVKSYTTLPDICTFRLIIWHTCYIYRFWQWSVCVKVLEINSHTMCAKNVTAYMKYFNFFVEILKKKNVYAKIQRKS